MKKFINKYVFLIFLVILTFTTFISFGFFLFKNYHLILNSFGIDVKENCVYKDNKLFCEYIHLKTSSVDIDADNLVLEIDLKKFFSKKRFIFLEVNKVDITAYKKKKVSQNKAFDIKRLKNTFKYAFYLFYRSSLIIHHLNFNNDTFRLADFSFKNENDKFFTLRPFTIYFKNKKAIVEKLYGGLNLDNLSLYVYLAKFNALNTNFIFTGFYSLRGKGEFAVHTFTPTYEFGDLKIFDVESISNVEIYSDRPTTINSTFSISSIINKENIKISQISGKLSGSYTKTFKGKLECSVSGISFKDNKFSTLHLLSKLDLNPDNFSIRSHNRVYAKSFENKILKINDIYSSFDLTKFSSVTVNGKFNIKAVNGSFSYTGSNIKTNVFPFKVANIIGWLKNKPEYLKNLDATVSIKSNLNLNSKTLLLNANLSNINLIGVKFNTGNVNLEYNTDFSTGNLSANFIGENSFVNLLSTIKKSNLNMDVKFENLDISNLVFTKKLKIASVLTGKGLITGSLDSPHIKIQGKAEYFYFDKIHIKQPIDFNLFYEKDNLQIYASSGNIKSVVSVNFKPVFVDVNIKAKNLNGNTVHPYLLTLNKDLFSKLKPERITGKVRVVYTPEDYFVDLDLKNTSVFVKPIKNRVNSNIKGYLSKKYRKLNISFDTKQLSYKNFKINELYGKINLLNQKIFINLYANGSPKLNSFKLKTFLFLNLNSRNVKSDVNLILSKFGYRLDSNLHLSGNFENISGNIQYNLAKGKKKISSSVVKLKLSKNSVYNLSLKSTKIPFYLDGKLKIVFNSPKADFYFSESSFDGYLSIDSILAKISRRKILKIEKILAEINDKRLHVYETFYTGIIKGEIKYIDYNIKTGKLDIASVGKINRDIVSQFVQVISIYGDINFSYEFTGRIQDIVEKSYIRLYSKDLKLKSNYVLGYVDLKTLVGYYKNSKIDITFNGENDFLLFTKGELSGQIKAKAKPLDLNAVITLKKFPVKFLDIYKGSVDSTLYIKYGKEKYITGKIGLSGQVNLKEDLLRKGKGKKFEKNETKDIHLNIKVYSFLPIYIHSNLGKAYAEVKGTLTGTLKNPIFNGEINIIYGKITYLKNNYNIDYANIKIIDNIPYVNARISTVIANTYIFINIVGIAPDNLKFNFSSTPPHSKEEIMAILLLKNTSSALESIPVISALGKLVFSLLPINKILPNPDESTGFLNSGFEVTITPKYTPTEGIVASIYAKRNITRRFFFAISKPISQTNQTTYIGWYEIGLKLTEKISITAKKYEDNTDEISIMFSLPFDF